VENKALLPTLLGILLVGYSSTGSSAPGQAYLSSDPPGRLGAAVERASKFEATSRSAASTTTSFQYLSSIWGASPTQIWTVGNKDSKVLVKFWSGGSWSDIPAPSPGTAAGLLGVGGTAANDVWGVGTYNNGSSLKTLTEHWDGSTWQVVPSVDPVSGAEATQLSSVFAVSKNDVWAVGVARQHNASSYVYSVIIEHFNGSAWTSVPNPAGARSAYLDAVHGGSATDIWAVGQYLDNYTPLVFHWDGSSWKAVAITTNPFNVNVSGVYQVSAPDVWIVGGSYLSLTEHWDGRAWTQINSPNPSTNSNFLNAVAGSSSTDVWAVGGYDYSNHTLIVHWDGNKWTTVKSPDPAPAGANALSGLAVFGPKDAWAVGDGFASGGLPIILHWDGDNWKSVAATESSSRLQPAAVCDASPEYKVIGDSFRNRQEHCPQTKR
jgi:hypothetical protein